MLGNIQHSVIRPARSSSPRRTAHRAFSLIEIMIVIIILLTLIAIFVPVLAGARNSARAAATKSLFNSLQASSSQFELDQRRLPGYFSQVSMGSAENVTRGFTQMQNMLLDLTGGVVASVTSPTGNRINVGPTTAGNATVDLDLINAPTESKGVVKNVYYNIDKKNWVSQTGSGQKVAIAAHKTLPDLLDSWSNPVLVWAEDDGAGDGSLFAAMDSSTRARFYWNSNAAFLEATALGRGAKDQTSMDDGSLLSITGVPSGATSIPLSMQGLLGHPAFPVTPVAQLPVPASSRSKIVFHSAGADGVFLGRKDRGGLLATAPVSIGHVTDVVDYKGSKGDPLNNFDDIVAVGGN